MHCISLAIFSRLSRFPSPAVGTNWPFWVEMLLKHQSINQSINQSISVICSCIDSGICNKCILRLDHIFLVFPCEIILEKFVQSMYYCNIWNNNFAYYRNLHRKSATHTCFHYELWILSIYQRDNLISINIVLVYSLVKLQVWMDNTVIGEFWAHYHCIFCLEKYIFLRHVLCPIHFPSVL